MLICTSYRHASTFGTSLYRCVFLMSGFQNLPSFYPRLRLCNTCKSLDKLRMKGDDWVDTAADIEEVIVKHQARQRRGHPRGHVITNKKLKLKVKSYSKAANRYGTNGWPANLKRGQFFVSYTSYYHDYSMHSIICKLYGFMH